MQKSQRRPSRWKPRSSITKSDRIFTSRHRKLCTATSSIKDILPANEESGVLMGRHCGIAVWRIRIGISSMRRLWGMRSARFEESRVFERGRGCAEWQRMHAAMNYGRRNAVEVCFGNSYAVRGITLRMCGRRIGCAWRVMGWENRWRSGGL